jgi:hypothetical protein
MKIRSVGAELFHSDGRTHFMTKLKVAFRNFANAPKKMSKQLLPLHHHHHHHHHAHEGLGVFSIP